MTIFRRLKAAWRAFRDSAAHEPPSSAHEPPSSSGCAQVHATLNGERRLVSLQGCVGHHTVAITLDAGTTIMRLITESDVCPGDLAVFRAFKTSREKKITGPIDATRIID